VSRRLAIAVLRGLRLLLLPFQSQTSLTPRLCKYEPTCSCYGEEAIRRHGVLRGSALALWRVVRCNPWSKGGYDPVPGEERVAAP
jgi:uncharacterized protein